MADPIDTTRGIVKEAERGRSERTPWIALSGVTVAVAVLVAAILAIAFAVYVLA
jgi:hypothetical protein